jgi:hypothetical protein
MMISAKRLACVAVATFITTNTSLAAEPAAPHGILLFEQCIERQRQANVEIRNLMAQWCSLLVQALRIR